MPTRFISGLLACALVAAACGSSDDAADETTTPSVASTTSSTEAATTTAPTTTTVPTTTTTTEPEPQGPLSPLTGLVIEDEELAENVGRRVLGVKIDNHWNARPQSGVEQADLVFELLVEAGLTRFIAVFHHTDVEFVGPMRSGRPTDPTLLRPLNGVITISGAQGWVQSRIRNAGVPIIGDLGSPITFRQGFRSAPHNLYTNTVELREVMDTRGYDVTPPDPVFTFGEFTAPDDAEAEEIFFNWSDTMDVWWEWDGDRYLRFKGPDDPHEWRTQEGDETGQLWAETLVVLFAPRYTASGGTGSAVPAFDTVGSGIALVFAEGRVQEGTWSRDEISELFDLRDADGEPMVVPPGKPWISIFPSNRNVDY